MKNSEMKYHAVLKPENVGERKRDVFYTLYEIVPQFRWKFDSFEKATTERDTIMRWDYLTSRQLEFIRQRLEVVGATLEIQEKPATFLLPTDRLDGTTNHWYSTTLIALGEDGLMEWAEGESVEEVYRFLEIPAFEPPTVIRLWSNREPQAILKTGIPYYPITETYPSPITKLEEWKLTENNWNKLRQFMDREGFWVENSWYTVQPGYSVLDGVRYIFEGYQNGNYQFLFDDSPDWGSAYRAANFFFQLRVNY